MFDVTGVLNNTDLDGDAYVFLRSKISGSVVDTRVLQENWDFNVASDRDWGTSQIFVIDFQSLRVGTISYYLNVKKELIHLHDIHNDNVRKSGYWQRPTLPVHWRQFNDATYTYTEFGYGDDENAVGFGFRTLVNAGASAVAICNAVKSEGGKYIEDLPGIPWVAKSAVGANKTVSTTKIPLLSIRVADTIGSIANRALVIPQAYSLYTNNPIDYEVWYRASVSGGADVWTSLGAETGVEVNVDHTTITTTNGYLVDSGRVSTDINKQASINNAILSKAIMALGRTGTSDILTIAAVKTGASDGSVGTVITGKTIR